MWCYDFALVVALLLQHRTAAESDEFSTSLVPIYEPYLANLPDDPSTFNPILGGQSFDMCCRLAVNESLYIKNGTLRKRPGQTVYRGDFAALEQFPSFPCTATFNGSLKGPHQDFWTSYSWCHERCPGWEATHADSFNSWLKPLVAFIFPSLIFCLNVPRRRRFELPSILFTHHHTLLSSFVWYLIKIPLASLIVTLDTIIWLAVVFAMAGPLLVSGIYEAILDLRTLNFLEAQIVAGSLTVQQRAHILFVILIGNLDQEPAWNHSKVLVNVLARYSFQSRIDTYPAPADEPISNTGMQVAQPASQVSQAEFVTIESAHTEKPTLKSANEPMPMPMPMPMPIQESLAHDQPINEAKKKLQAMLDAQYSFGGTTGAPVLFFVGSFVWTCFEIKSSFGSYSSAHQLAFGMMWTTIPHIAIVSSFLLAGNNPGIWQGIAPYVQDSNALPRVSTLGTGRLTSRIRGPIFDRFKNPYSSMYPNSQYKPAWMWNRGPNKAMWLAKYAEEYEIDTIHKEIHSSRFSAHLLIPGFCAFVLIFIPVFFGTLISYTTPQVGFSCRSLTMLVYGAVQTLLIVLWLCDWCFWRRDRKGRVKCALDLESCFCWSEWVWYICFAVCISVSVLTSIGGTCFVLMGLYSNCLCSIQAKYWWNRMVDPRAALFFNSATIEQIYYAKKFWFPGGIVGTTFLTFVAYLGWWYQRSLRVRFHTLTTKIDHNSQKEMRNSNSVAVAGVRQFIRSL